MRFDLVFEGGGAKGMVFAGALQEFEARDHTVGRLMGTSAGAIMATFLAAGYTAEEMAAALAEKIDDVPVFAGFLGAPDSFDRAVIEASATRRWLQESDNPLLPRGLEERVDDWIIDNLLASTLYRHIFSFVELGGWYAADSFIEWMRRKLDEGAFEGQPRSFSDMTMEQFFSKTGKDLTLLAADVTDGRLLVLNHRTAPRLPLVYAVRMSMSVPLLWQEVIWREAWGPYRQHDISGNAVVDGGLLSNFPIELFITEDPMWTKVMGPKRSTALIGLLIDEGLPVEGVDKESSSGRSLGDSRTLGRLKALVETVTQARDKGVISAYKQFVVRLPARYYGTTEFNMPDWKREALVRAGQQAMADYFNEMGDELPSTSPAEEAFGFYIQADEIASHLLGDT